MRFLHEIEKQIITKALNGAVAKGAKAFGIFDGEDYSPAMSLEMCKTEIGETDETTVYFYASVEDAANDRPLGWVWFIHGNGCDVLSDYSASPWMEATLAEANAHAVALSV